jgi:transcriptional regulator with XRE-family HTH domain
LIEKPKKRVGRPLSYDKFETNLISTWKEVVTRSGTLTEALKLINDYLGLKITHSRLSDWEKGKRAPSPTVINYLLAESLRDKLTELEIEYDQIEEIILQLSIPVRKDNGK